MTDPNTENRGRSTLLRSLAFALPHPSIRWLPKMHLSAMGTQDRDRHAWQSFEFDGFCIEARMHGLPGHSAAGQDRRHNSYNARRNPRLIRSGASCLRGHRQYTVHAPAMTRLAAIQHKRQNSTVCIRPPSSPVLHSGLQTSMRVQRARMRSLHREM